MQKQRSGGEEAAGAAALRRRIERWRETRGKRTRMPEELWAAATALARAHGVSRVARTLGIGYETLKERVSDAGASGVAAEFVAIDGATLLGGAAPTVVEVTDRRGRRLVVRLSGAVDVPAVVAAFVGRPA